MVVGTEAASGPIRAHVQFGDDIDVPAYRERFHQGLVNDETPFGFHHAEEDGVTLTFSRIVPRPPRWLPLRVSRKLLGIDLPHAWANRDRLRDAEAIWTMTEGEAFAVALLMALRIVPARPIVANAVWLFDRWDGLPWHRRLLFRFLARWITVLTVHSDGCLPIARRALPGKPVARTYFGINLASFPITPPVDRVASGGPIRIFAAGNDRTRDWDTLLAAFAGDSRFALTVVCHWLDPAAIAATGNLTVPAHPSMAEFRALYDEADFVAVPMRPNIFSGITVALEGTALGKPLLVSRTGGVPTYFDEREAFYVPCADPVAMRQAVLDSTADTRLARAAAAQARFVRDDYSTRATIGRYVDSTRIVLGRP